MGLFDFFKPDIESHIKNKNVKGLIKALNYKKDKQMRERAAVTLGEIGDPSALQALFNVVHDNNFMLRIKALEAIGKIGNRGAVEPLITLLNEPHYHLQEIIIDALGKIGSERAAEGLMAFLYTEKEKKYRDQAKKVISKMGADAAPVLVRTIISKNWELKNFAISAITGIGAPAVPALINALKENDPVMIIQAGSLLGRIKDSRSAEHLLPLLDHQNLQVRNTAKTALKNLTMPPQLKAEYFGKIRDWNGLASIGREGVPYLLKGLEDKSNHPVLIKALVNISDERLVEPLIPILNNRSNFCRRDVILPMEKSGGKKVIPYLKIAFEDDKDGIVRKNALASLERLMGKELVDYLAYVVKDGDDFGNMELIKLLEKYENDNQLGFLIKLAGHKTPNIRLMSFQALGRLKHREAVEALIAGLKDNVLAVRSAAVKALGEIGDSRAVEPLMKLFDEDQKLTEALIDAFGMFNDKRTVGLLIEAFNNNSSLLIRKKAFQALVNMNAEEATEVFLEALKSPDVFFRDKALEGLLILEKENIPLVAAYKAFHDKDWEKVKSFGEVSIDYLLAGLYDRDYDVRTNSALLLGDVGDGRAVDALRVFLERNDKAMMSYAETSLKKLEEKFVKDPKEAAKLAVARKDWEKVISMGDIAYKPLFEALKRCSWTNIKEVEGAIEKIGKPVYETLLEEFKDKTVNSHARSSMIRLLGKFGDSQAVEPLIKELAFNDVRLSAVNVLGDLEIPGR